VNLKNSSIAINWVEPNSQIWSENVSVYEKVPPEAISSVQTSVMTVTYNFQQMFYCFKIDHRGDQVEYNASHQVLHQEPKIIYTLLDLLIERSDKMWGVSDQVPKQLVKAWTDKVLINPPQGAADYLAIKQSELTHMPASYAAGWPEYANGGLINPAAEHIPVSAIVTELPGVNERVTHPMRGLEYRLADCIMNLNDEFRWTREQIADWIETLDINTTFKVDVNE